MLLHRVDMIALVAAWNNPVPYRFPYKALGGTTPLRRFRAESNLRFLHSFRMQIGCRHRYTRE